MWATSSANFGRSERGSTLTFGLIAEFHSDQLDFTKNLRASYKFMDFPFAELSEHVLSGQPYMQIARFPLKPRDLEIALRHGELLLTLENNNIVVAGGKISLRPAAVSVQNAHDFFERGSVPLYNSAGKIGKIKLRIGIEFEHVAKPAQQTLTNELDNKASQTPAARISPKCLNASVQTEIRKENSSAALVPPSETVAAKPAASKVNDRPRSAADMPRREAAILKLLSKIFQRQSFNAKHFPLLNELITELEVAAYINQMDATRTYARPMSAEVANNPYSRRVSTAYNRHLNCIDKYYKDQKEYRPTVSPYFAKPVWYKRSVRLPSKVQLVAELDTQDLLSNRHRHKLNIYPEFDSGQSDRNQPNFAEVVAQAPSSSKQTITPSKVLPKQGQKAVTSFTQTKAMALKSQKSKDEFVKFAKPTLEKSESRKPSAISSISSSSAKKPPPRFVRKSSEPLKVPSSPVRRPSANNVPALDIVPGGPARRSSAKTVPVLKSVAPTEEVSKVARSPEGEDEDSLDQAAGYYSSDNAFEQQSSSESDHDPIESSKEEVKGQQSDESEESSKMIDLQNKESSRESSEAHEIPSDPGSSVPDESLSSSSSKPTIKGMSTGREERPNIFEATQTSPPRLAATSATSTARPEPSRMVRLSVDRGASPIPSSFYSDLDRVSPESRELTPVSRYLKNLKSQQANIAISSLHKLHTESVSSYFPSDIEDMSDTSLP